MTAVLHKLFPSPPSKIPNLLTPTVSEKQDLILKIAINRDTQITFGHHQLPDLLR